MVTGGRLRSGCRLGRKAEVTAASLRPSDEPFDLDRSTSVSRHCRCEGINGLLFRDIVGFLTTPAAGSQPSVVMGHFRKCGALTKMPCTVGLPPGLLRPISGLQVKFKCVVQPRTPLSGDLRHESNAVGSALGRVFDRLGLGPFLDRRRDIRGQLNAHSGLDAIDANQPRLSD